MGALISGVTSLVRAMAPDHENRWSDDLIESAIFLADTAIREEADVEWASYEISLVDGAIYYALPTEVIGVSSVEFSTNGTLYDEWVYPVTMQDMDEISYTWETDTGTRPEMYFLQSAPGTTNYSKIALWRPIVTVGSQKVRVNYTKCVATVGDLSAATMPDDIQQEVYLPYVLFLLMVAVNPQEAAAYLAQYKNRIGWARSRFSHKLARPTYPPRRMK